MRQYATWKRNNRIERIKQAEVELALHPVTKAIESSSERVIMKKSILIKGLLIAVSLPLLAGCVVYRQPPPPVAVAPAGEVVVDTAPPPPQVEVVPVCPGPVELWFWVPGRWVWRDHWVWVGGSWQSRPHPHAVWVAGHWGWRHHGYVWIDGHWR
jgi:hypothetical protein